MEIKIAEPINKQVFVIVLILLFFILPGINCLACDIAVVSAKASEDGRPFIWKNRDNSASWHQEVKYYEAVNPEPGGYVLVCDYSEYLILATGSELNHSGGVNEAGFAIACSSVYEEFNPLHEIVNINTDLVRQALQECVTLEDFENILKDWHTENELCVISGNFVAIDASGGAALYECFTGFQIIPGPINYQKFDANTGRVTDRNGTVLEEGTVDFIGFQNRTNSNTYIPWNYGEERRHRGTLLLTQLVEAERLSYRNVMSEVAKDTEGKQPNPEDIDEENYSTTFCISRSQTRMGMVAHGVNPDDDPHLTTFWCALGEPSSSVFIPFFPKARSVSPLAWVDGIDIDGNNYDLNDTSMLNRAMNSREISGNLLYECNTGAYTSGPDDSTINMKTLRNIQEWTFPLEDKIIEETEYFLNTTPLTSENLKSFSDYCTQYAFKNYIKASSNYFQWDFETP